MNMNRMKDECLFLLVLVASSLVSHTGGLFISQESATKSVNETFFVLCRDEAGRPVSWRGPKGLLGPKTRPVVQIASYGTTVIFNGTVLEDSGSYTCSAGTEQKQFNLTIETPLTFMDTDSEQIGIETKEVILRCEVRGGKVTWSVEGGAITDHKKFMVIADGLLIKNVHRTDSKTYICKAVQQSTGTVVDRKIKLKVLHQPIFPHPMYAKQEIVWAYVNGTVNLTCIMTANPPATFEWMKASDRNKKIGKVINESDDVSILQLHVDKSTFGDYKCIAYNAYGKLEKFFELQQGSQPHAPKFIELRGANSNLLDLGIHGPDKNEVEIQPGMETRGYQVQYKSQEEGNWESREFNISQEDSYLLDSLRHDTEYEVKAATRNAAGLSDFTNTSTFKTLTSQAADGVHLTLPTILGVGVNWVLTLLLPYCTDMSMWR